MTPNSISKNVLNTVAGATNIAASGGVLQITGAPAIRQSKVVSARWMTGYAGQGQQATLTANGNVIVANKTYVFQVTQTIGNQTIDSQVSVTSTGTNATTFYAAVLDAVTALVNQGRLLVTSTSSSGTGVVIISSAASPIINYVSITSGTELWSVVYANVTGTPNAVTVSAAAGAPTVIGFAGNVPNKVVGGLYRVTLSGFTGADAATLNGKTFHAVFTALNSLSVFVDTDSLTITLGSGEVAFLPDATLSFTDVFGTKTNSFSPVAGYVASNNYLGLEVVYYQEGDPGEANLRLNPYASQTLFITNSTAALLCAAYLGAETAVGSPISGTLK